MSEINENRLLEKLHALLKNQEKLEHFAKPLKESYDELHKQQVGWSVIGFFVASMLYLHLLGHLPFSHISVIVYLAFNMFTIIFAYNAVKVKKTYPHSLYAYSNMRLFFTTSHDPKIKYVYFKDIHELKTQDQKIVIDTGDTYNDASENSQKRLQYIIGVQNPEDFVKKIDQKLQKFRMPS
jgi:hypothetical protein